MLDRFAFAGIWAYQRFLSPLKGYRCAYSVKYGGTGCSGYAKHAIKDNGLLGAIPLIKVRFQSCKTAAQSLCQSGQCVYSQSFEDVDSQNKRARRTPRKRRKPARKRDKWDFGVFGCDSFSCGCEGISCLQAAPRGCGGCSPNAARDCSPRLGCNSFNGTNFDCGNLDCGSCDCGGCS